MNALTLHLKLAYVSGSRSDFGVMRPVLKALQEDGWHTAVVITGMNLLPEYRSICEVIASDGHTLYHVDTHLAGDSGAAMSKTFGLAILGLTDALTNLAPDLLLIQGDRGEALASALVAGHLNIPVVHMAGGDVTGSIDDKFRHSISQFAALHLPATADAAALLYRICPKAEAIVNVGDPALDQMVTGEIASEEDVWVWLHLPPGSPFLLVAQHPVTTEADEAAGQMAEIMAGLDEMGLDTVLILPNLDAGGRAMRDVIEAYRGRQWLRIVSDMKRHLYLGVVRHCVTMVGNSSSGIVEAPTFGTPVVNVGSRQAGRVRGQNVIDVPPRRDAIVAAIQRVLGDPGLRRRLLEAPNPYGDGQTAEKVVEILGRFARTGDRRGL